MNFFFEVKEMFCFHPYVGTSGEEGPQGGSGGIKAGSDRIRAIRYDCRVAVVRVNYNIQRTTLNDDIIPDGGVATGTPTCPTSVCPRLRC